MSVLTFIHSAATLVQKGATLSEYERLTEQLSRIRAKGSDNVKAGAMLFIEEWSLPKTPDTLARATLLSQNLGELAIGFLMFSKKIGVAKATGKALLQDPFFNYHQCLYGTAGPVTDFARKYMNLIWNHKHVNPGGGSDAGFAAYYATLIAPFAVHAWMMLVELRQLGFCPDIDRRDHVKEGITKASIFLQTSINADPDFCTLLQIGIVHLSKMELQAPMEQGQSEAPDQQGMESVETDPDEKPRLRQPPTKPDMTPVQPDDKLAKIVGEKPVPRSEVTKSFWVYVRKHGLQDTTDRNLIHADENLKAVFNGKTQVTPTGWRDAPAGQRRPSSSSGP